MAREKIYVLGDPDIVLLLGLLGIEGKIINDKEDFLKTFDEIIKDSSIGLIIISFKLSEDMIDYLIKFKIENRYPFVFILPRMFEKGLDASDIILKRISESIRKNIG